MPARKRKSRWKPRKRKVKISPLAAVCSSAALILAIFLICHRWGSGAGAERGAKVPPGSWRYGIDISHNNSGKIAWDSLRVMTDGRRRTVRDPYSAKDIKPVSFVIVKATEGATFKDPDFQGNWREAGRSSLRRGAYHFFRSSKDGTVQARNFITTVGDMRIGDLPPVLDIETIHLGCSRELLNQRALQWLRTVGEHYGKKPVVYASASFIKDHLDKEITDNYPIWVAHYGKERPAREEWVWWQFTDRAVVKGVPGQVDLSVMRAD
ncbi:MAG: hypothetical protein IJK05_02565 [Bacteroidales bacterium]|nr:hypothetical protein [Bacteroidales bacterium]